MPFNIFLLAFSSFLAKSAMADDLKTMFYSKTYNMTCNAKELQSEMIVSLNQHSCSLFCTKSDKPCLGFGYSAGKCELCFISLQISGAHPLNTEDVHYSSFPGFGKEYYEGMECFFL